MPDLEEFSREFKPQGVSLVESVGIPNEQFLGGSIGKRLD